MRLAEELGVQLYLPSYQVFLALERFTAGNWDEALAEAQASLELAEEVGENYFRVSGQIVRSLILLHRNDLPGAVEAVEAAEAELSATGPRYRSHWARWARALVLEAEGQAGQAYAVLAGCWDWCARHGLALEYRMLGPDLVRLALASGDADQARPLLEEALAFYEQLDAARDLARTEAVLRGAGIGRGRRGPRGRPKFGWASLTPAEQAVVALVADGLTNPQIGARLYISRRTVQTHLVHVFAKLDIASRAQLAAQVARHRG
jgi:DNA-binding CsgD family transcriptional regulator/tetratricopeptide (TPR) repeat protein